MRARWSLIFRIYGIVAFLLPLASSAQQTAQPRFTTAGIQVVVNRAVRPGSAPQLVLSLVMTNIGDDDVAVVAPEMPMVITDTGGSGIAQTLSGIPLSGCGPEIRYCVEMFGFTPTFIERDNSITITIIFAANPNSTMCSLDFSMPVFVQRGGRSASWRRITVGLPNVRVC